jgi:hypothetical protein
MNSPLQGTKWFQNSYLHFSLSFRSQFCIIDFETRIDRYILAKWQLEWEQIHNSLQKRALSWQSRP